MYNKYTKKNTLHKASKAINFRSRIADNSRFEKFRLDVHCHFQRVKQQKAGRKIYFLPSVNLDVCDYYGINVRQFYIMYFCFMLQTDKEKQVSYENSSWAYLPQKKLQQMLDLSRHNVTKEITALEESKLLVTAYSEKRIFNVPAGAGKYSKQRGTIMQLDADHFIAANCEADVFRGKAPVIEAAKQHAAANRITITSFLQSYDAGLLQLLQDRNISNRNNFLHMLHKFVLQYQGKKYSSEYLQKKLNEWLDRELSSMQGIDSLLEIHLAATEYISKFQQHQQQKQL